MSPTYTILYVGLAECQDGVTNNCSQNCTRHLINETMSYEYECTCDVGFAANRFGYCKGEIFHAYCMSRLTTTVNVITDIIILSVI